MSKLESLSLNDLTTIHNNIAARYEGYEPIKRFSDKKTAISRITAMTKKHRDPVIFVLKPDYAKRGKAKERFPLYRDGMLRSEYVEACVQAKHDRGEAMRDVRYDAHLGLIELAGV